VENYDILTNGFSFFSSSAVSVSLHTPTIFASFFFRLLFVPFEVTHIAPWRLLLRLSHFKILMDSFNFPKKKLRIHRRGEETKQEKSFRGSLSSFTIVVEHNYEISQGLVGIAAMV
jgi:hypothetical protein